MPGSGILAMDKGIDPKSRVQNRARNERQRFLNIIYFLDSHRTRTLKFTVKSAGITLSILILLLGWSFVASFLLIQEYQVNSDLRVRTRSLLTTIFEYQTRYDEVYEKAYPEKESRVISVAEEGASSEIGKYSEEKENTSITNAQSTKNSNMKTTEAAKPSDESHVKEKVVSQSLEEKLQKLDFPILVENFSFNVQNDVLTTRFSLKNTKSPNRAAGTVQATSKFMDSKQKVMIVEMDAVDEGAEGAGDEAESSSDQHYNIRYYKNKKFSFAKPQGVSGQFISVTITLKDDVGRKKDYSFPVEKNLEQPSRASNLEEAQRPYAKAVPQEK